MVADGVEERTDGEGLVHLRREVDPGKGLWARLARRFGFRKDFQVNLDQHGSSYWRLVDGERNLKEIARLLKKEHSLSERESRDATIVFTKQLMLRYLIYLKMPSGRER